MKDKILSIIFIVLLNIVLILNIIIPDNEISITERRKLEQFPSISINNILNKKFMKELDSYVLDQFILRDYFRKIKAKINYNVLKKLDNNRIYIHNSHIFKSEYPTNKKSINNFLKKINYIETSLTKDNKTYYSIIPDKNYYLNSNKYLNMDYDYLYEQIKNINYTYIELRDILSLDDYYKTDIHWKQENLCKVVNRLGEYLNFNTNCNYSKKTYNNFYGVYYGQSALNIKPDIITTLTNSHISNSQVYYLDNELCSEVYIEDYINNLDGYDIYLKGPSPYIEITNKLNNNSKELIIFRDSFTSSLAPLLIEYYSKITLIDTRYIDTNTYLERIEFNNQDILFLYSTLLVNNSYTLKD